MSIFDFGFKPSTKKQRKSATLRDNQRRGKAAEDQVMMCDRMMGYEVERTGRGHDCRRIMGDPWTQRITRSEEVEVKSSDTAPMSDLQKKNKKRKK